MKCAAKDRGRLDSAFRDVVEETGSVRHLVFRVEEEILDIELTEESEEVTEAVRNCLQEETSSEVKVFMTKRPFRGTRKAYLLLEETRAGAAGDVVWKGTPREPAPRNRSATVAPLGKISPGLIISRELCVARLCVPHSVRKWILPRP